MCQRIPSHGSMEERWGERAEVMRSMERSLVDHDDSLTDDPGAGRPPGWIMPGDRIEARCDIRIMLARHAPSWSGVLPKGSCCIVVCSSVYRSWDALMAEVMVITPGTGACRWLRVSTDDVFTAPARNGRER